MYGGKHKCAVCCWWYKICMLRWAKPERQVIVGVESTTQQIDINSAINHDLRHSVSCFDTFQLEVNKRNIDATRTTRYSLLTNSLLTTSQFTWSNSYTWSKADYRANYYIYSAVLVCMFVFMYVHMHVYTQVRAT